MKVVVASDSFKGSLSSAEVGEAVKEGVLAVAPDARVTIFSVGDGGEGTADSLTKALNGEKVCCKVKGPLGAEVTAEYGVTVLSDVKTALIDMASASGLTLIADSEKDILKASSYGTGQLLVDAYHRGCRRFVIGLGGSASCDGGTGMLSALGVKFFNKSGNLLPGDGETLLKIENIDINSARKDIMECEFIIMCDVDNPLCGERGAAEVFAPQKGASAEEVCSLSGALKKYAMQLERLTGKKIESIPKGGAAGGLGAAFLSFFNCVLKSGGEVALDLLDFDDALKDVDLVLTGEGKMDNQTLWGKLPAIVCRRANKHNIPVVGIAGMVENTPEFLKFGFTGVFSIQSGPCTLQESINFRNTFDNISNLLSSIVRLLKT